MLYEDIMTCLLYGDTKRDVEIVGRGNLYRHKPPHECKVPGCIAILFHSIKQHDMWRCECGQEWEYDYSAGTSNIVGLHWVKK